MDKLGSQHPVLLERRSKNVKPWGHLSWLETEPWGRHILAVRACEVWCLELTMADSWGGCMVGRGAGHLDGGKCGLTSRLYYHLGCWDPGFCWTSVSSCKTE